MIAWVSCVGTLRYIEKGTSILFLRNDPGTIFVGKKQHMIKAKIVKNSLFLKWED